MRIRFLSPDPVGSIPYRLAAPGGNVAMALLPLLSGTVDTLPAGLQALVCLADLQGIEARRGDDGTPRLLGEVVAEELSLLAAVGEIPPAGSIGVLIAGDLYAAPAADQRGVEGDVLPVWNAFHTAFRWVAGVAGNHDQLDTAALTSAAGTHCLDGVISTVDTLRIAGIGGIIGNPAKRGRRAEADYTANIKALARSKPDILILHQSPAIEEQGFLGSPAIRTALEATSIPLVVCGHTRWPQPLVELPTGCQILNVDSRVVVLTRA